MSEWSPLLIPAAFVVLVVAAMVFFFIRTARNPGRRQSIEAMPEIAARLGLTFTVAALAHNIGELSGTYRGRRIRVLPDEGSRIEIELRQALPVELSTFAPQTAPPEGMHPFESGDSEFDRFFKKRFGTADAEGRLRGASVELAPVADFAKRWRRKLRFLKQDEEKLVCCLDYGASEPYIPKHLLEPIVEDLSTLADTLEQTLL